MFVGCLCVKVRRDKEISSVFISEAAVKQFEPDLILDHNRELDFEKVPNYFKLFSFIKTGRLYVNQQNIHGICTTAATLRLFALEKYIKKKLPTPVGAAAYAAEVELTVDEYHEFRDKMDPSEKADRFQLAELADSLQSATHINDMDDRLTMSDAGSFPSDAYKFNLAQQKNAVPVLIPAPKIDSSKVLGTVQPEQHLEQEKPETKKPTYVNDSESYQTPSNSSFDKIYQPNNLDSQQKIEPKPASPVPDPTSLSISSHDSNFSASPKNFINPLQEYCVSNALAIPTYNSTKGADGVFEVDCIIKDVTSTQAHAKIENTAKREAARKMLELLRKQTFERPKVDTIPTLDTEIDFFYSKLLDKKNKPIAALKLPAVRDDGRTGNGQN